MSRVSLPLLDVGIPILAFYILTPWIVLLLHFNLLLQLHLLATKLHTFDAALNNIEATTERDAYRDQLFPFLFSHMLIGHHHERLARWLLKLAIWVTVLFLPLLFLVVTQTRFLPYHSETITWSHRIAVTLGVLLQWILWPMIASPRRYRASQWHQRALTAWRHWRPLQGMVWLLTQNKLPRRFQATATWVHHVPSQRGLASGFTFLLTSTLLLSRSTMRH